MSIIVNIPMPRGCIDCPIRQEKNIDWVRCPLTEMSYLKCDVTNNRMEKCPIKGEITDRHGRLIDADGFAFRVRVSCHTPEAKEFHDGVNTVLGILREQRTVVPAERRYEWEK